MVGNLPQIESDNDSFAVTDLARYGTNTSFAYQMQLPQQGQSTITLPITYIPNYEVTVNGSRCKPSKRTAGGWHLRSPSPAAASRCPIRNRCSSGCVSWSASLRRRAWLSQRKRHFQVIE